MVLYDEEGNQVGIGKENGNGGLSITIPNWNSDNRGYTVKVQAKNGSTVNPDAEYHLSFQTTHVDGSFDERSGVYGYGCVVIKNDGAVEKYYGAGNNPESVKLRNVAGEMLAAMNAVRYAMQNGYKSVNICYDYSGIEMWATGEWKTNNALTMKYARAMQEWGEKISIMFQKVAAHTGVEYNEAVDQLAKFAVSNFCKENGIGNEMR